ncbi:methyltransferase domain-containing protein [Pyronema domesticum]|nr:methyltransferase domain-containing protein [Pyronema domesticum]
MPPTHPLPLSDRFLAGTPDEYVESLLTFSEDPLFRILCGGIHILDFFTRDSEDEPKDIYRTIMPQDWIGFFARQNINYILDLLLRLPYSEFPTDIPETLDTYIRNVRDHTLQRDFVRREASERAKKRVGFGTEWALNAGMRPKKIHEVEFFAAYLDDLVRDIRTMDETEGGDGVSHVVDYGSGQAYLTRTLAKKYGHDSVGIESRPVNIDGAKTLDKMFDSIADKKLRYKKRTSKEGEVVPDRPVFGTLQYVQTYITDGSLDEVVEAIHDVHVQPAAKPTPAATAECEECVVGTNPEDADALVKDTAALDINGTTGRTKPKSLLLTSLHSCGNLVHHALTAFRTTPAVRAVALIGCCYNLLTEKSGATFKPPFLRAPHPRLITTATSDDPKGFPISSKLTEHRISFNITARSMACQAPSNWTETSSAEFFLRHYYRALLQRLLIDKGVIAADCLEPLIIGSLPKQCYVSFYDYAVAALGKMKMLDQVEFSKEEAEEYVIRFETRRQELEVVWSLMAFSAGVVESVIVVDRWMYLREMGCKKAWVEAAFEHSESPRNFVVVGLR